MVRGDQGRRIVGGEEGWFRGGLERRWILSSCGFRAREEAKRMAEKRRQLELRAREVERGMVDGDTLLDDGAGTGMWRRVAEARAAPRTLHQ